MGMISGTYFVRLLTKRTGTKLLPVFFVLLLGSCKAQQKSTNVQSVDGRRFYIHTIEKKQSIYAIARLYQVPIDTIFRLNPEVKNGAKAGQDIRIPVTEQQQVALHDGIDTSRYLTHRIAKGETVYSLSRRYGLSEKQIMTFNPSLTAGAREGQLIIVGEKTKKRGRDQKQQPVTTSTVTLPSLPVDTAAFIPPSKPAKQQYRISLLLPFKFQDLETLDAEALLRANRDFPPVPAIAADFFLGCKRAVDSLAGPNFSLTMQLYDVDDNDSATVNALSKDPEFLSSDIIVGPLFASSFRTASQKAAELQTPIISPFTQQNKILFNNIFISKTSPSAYTLLESLADYCIDSLSNPRSNFILMTVHARDKREGNYTEAFKNYFNNRIQQMGRHLTDTIRTARGIEGMKKVFSDSVRNVIIALSSNQVFIADFTTQLAIHSAGKNVILCGWEAVTGMDNIDQEYLNQLQYTFPHQYDATRRRIPALDRYYKSQQNTVPTDHYYYAGFDVMHYYLKNLRDHGPGFIHRLEQLPMDGAYLRFRFTRPDLTTGYDNRGVFIFRYKDYQLHKTKW